MTCKESQRLAQKQFEQGETKMTTHKITGDGKAAVAPECIWIPIDASTPRGVSMWLINKRSGVAQKGHHYPEDKFFDHWFPLPTFKKEAE